MKVLKIIIKTLPWLLLLTVSYFRCVEGAHPKVRWSRSIDPKVRWTRSTDQVLKVHRSQSKNMKNLWSLYADLDQRIQRRPSLDTTIHWPPITYPKKYGPPAADAIISPNDNWVTKNEDSGELITADGGEKSAESSNKDKSSNEVKSNDGSSKLISITLKEQDVGLKVREPNDGSQLQHLATDPIVSS